MYDRARQIDEASLGPQTWELASIWRNLGIIYQKSKQYADAQFAYGRAIQIYELSPASSAQLFSCLRADADVLRKLDRFSEAEQADVQASNIQVRTAIEAEKKTTIAAAAFAGKN
ncbi:MAG: tetratricopeptide repeat protein, partial [Bryobacteraceae bacterium]